MYKQTVNTYQGGMNQDVSTNKSTQDVYYEALNFRVATREGGSLLALENEKGNAAALSIPDVNNEYRVCFDETITVVAGQPDYLYMVITIVGGSSYDITLPAPLSGSTVYDITDIYNEVEAALSSEVTSGNVILSLDDECFYITGAYEDVSVQDVAITSNGGTLTNTIAAQKDLKIIGVGGNREWLVLFTTNSEAEEPDSYGQIWKCRYIEGQGIIDGAVGGSLVVSTHLVYNGKLDFSTAHKILDVSAKYIDDSVIKVYWSDGYNYLRHINIADDDTISLPPDALDIVGDTVFSPPVLKNISMGGNYRSGKVQYAYQYYRANGSVTKFSPASALYHLSASSEDVSNTYEYLGSDDDVNTGKSLEVELSDIDTNYDFVRVVAIHFEDPYQSPTVGIVSVEPISVDTTTLNIVDNGTYDGTYTAEEYAIMATLPFIPKTLAVKDNRLIAANIKEPTFDVDFDARAYRADNGGIFVVGDKDGDSVTLSSPTFDLDEDHDAINPDQYTYRFDSAGNIGGSGKNISYRVTTDTSSQGSYSDIILDDDVASRSIGTTEKINTTVDLGNKDIYLKGFRNYASPFYEELVGYQRDETYRFAIVFYNSKGQPSFPKWIADIKIPSLAELSDPFVGNLFYRDGGYVKSKVVHIDFDVNIPFDIAGDVEGWEIVRVERGNDDKSIVAQGLVEIMEDPYTFPAEVGGSPNQCLRGTPYNTFTDAHYSFYDIASYRVHDSDDEHLHRFISPDIELIDNFVPNGDALQLVGYISSEHSFYKRVDDDADNYEEKTLKNKELTRVTGDSSSINIIAQERGSISDDVIAVGSNRVRNYLACYSGEYYMYKGKCLFIQGDGWFFTRPSWAAGDSNDTGVFDDYTGLGFIFANYKRSLTSQYGGNTYADRSTNVYIPTGSYVSGGGSATVSVYGGDTYISYYDYLNSIIDINATDYADSSQDAIFVPVESTVNLNLRHDLSFSRLSGGNESDYHNMFDDTFAKYNEAYSRQDNIRPFVAEPINFTAIEHNDTKLLISEKKVGADREDSWLVFKPNNEGEVDSRHGAINKILNFKDKLMFYQDTAFGMLAVNERVVTQTETGAELVLGSGDVFGDHGYISVMTGSQHHGGVCQSNNYLYHYDALQKTFMQYNLGVTEKPLSTLKGMSSFFRDYNGYVKEYDNVLKGESFGLNNFPVGVVSVYDNTYNRVLFTIHDVNRTEINPGIYDYTQNQVTIGYNEIIGSFESLYSYKPNIYYSHRNKMLSCELGDTLYEHDRGDYGEFYGITYDSYITHMLAPVPYYTKMFTNHEFNSTVEDDSGDIYDETFSKYRAWNSYQDTGEVTLTQPSPMRRIFRNWRIGIPFAADSRARMADRYMYAKMSYVNNSNKRMVAHDLVTWYSLRKY